MREQSRIITQYKSYIIDDGWNLPYEVIEEIEYRISEAKADAYRRVCEEHNRHKGGWLTAEIARKYAAKLWIYRVAEENQFRGKVREIAKELQELYGVTEFDVKKWLGKPHIYIGVNSIIRM